MKGLIFSLIFIGTTFFASAQTCVGIYRINLIHPKTLEMIGDKLTKSIWYVYTGPEDIFYDEVIEVVPFPETVDSSGFTIKHGEPRYDFVNVTETTSDIEFFPHCGLYLVQMEFVDEKDTMRLGIYNIPVHQYMILDSVKFQKGDFFFDMQSSELLHEVTFQENTGYFLFPPTYIEEFADDDEEGEEE